MLKKEVAFSDLLFYALPVRPSSSFLAQKHLQEAEPQQRWYHNRARTSQPQSPLIMTAAQETVVLQGHIIDSLILAKVLDTILMMGGTFDLSDVRIGTTRQESSRATITVRAASHTLLGEILTAIQPHGASVGRETDCTVEPVATAGVFPD